MNRRQFLCGVAAAALVPTALQASTQVNPELARLAVEFHNRMQAANGVVEKALSEQWFLVDAAHSPTLRRILWTEIQDPTNWSTEDLKYPTMHVKAIDCRDWVGSRGQ